MQTYAAVIIRKFCHTIPLKVRADIHSFSCFTIFPDCIQPRWSSINRTLSNLVRLNRTELPMDHVISGLFQFCRIKHDIYCNKDGIFYVQHEVEMMKHRYHIPFSQPTHPFCSFTGRSMHLSQPPPAHHPQSKTLSREFHEFHPYRHLWFMTR